MAPSCSADSLGLTAGSSVGVQLDLGGPHLSGKESAHDCLLRGCLGGMCPTRVLVSLPISSIVAVISSNEQL
jgi:hypothetical protein